MCIFFIIVQLFTGKLWCQCEPPNYWKLLHLFLPRFCYLNITQLLNMSQAPELISMMKKMKRFPGFVTEMDRDNTEIGLGFQNQSNEWNHAQVWANETIHKCSGKSLWSRPAYYIHSLNKSVSRGWKQDGDFSRHISVPFLSNRINGICMVHSRLAALTLNI